MISLPLEKEVQPCHLLMDDYASRSLHRYIPILQGLLLWDRWLQLSSCHHLLPTVFPHNGKHRYVQLYNTHVHTHSTFCDCLAKGHQKDYFKKKFYT